MFCTGLFRLLISLFTFQCRIFRPLASPFSINRNCQNHEILLLKDSSLLLVYSFARRRRFFVRGCFDCLPAHSQLTKIRYGIFPTHCFFRRIASSFTFEVLTEFSFFRHKRGCYPLHPPTHSLLNISRNFSESFSAHSHLTSSLYETFATSSHYSHTLTGNEYN